MHQPATIIPLPVTPRLSKDAFNTRVVANLELLREQQGLSMGALERQGGCAATAVRAFRNHRGKQGCNLYMAWNIAGALGVSLDTLCGPTEAVEALGHGSQPTPVASASQVEELRRPRVHQLLRAVAGLSDDALELLVSTALELQALLGRHGQAEA